MFHRLTVPTYLGGLPSGANYLNTPSLSGGTGIPAFMDGRKVGGPNDGTYFAAFGEDATSAFINRGMKALGENTDYLDDVLHRSIALTARTNDVVSTGIFHFQIAGDVFVGSLGTPNTAGNRAALISVLDANDNELLDAAGFAITVSGIENGGGLNVVGTEATGFYNTPTIMLSSSIPAGVTYRVYYGYPGTLAELPQDAFTTIKIRSAQEVSAGVERMFASLHTAVPNSDWSAPWAASISSLARTGLDGRYRLTSTDPGPTPMNVPGAGSLIYRDGAALTMALPAFTMTDLGSHDSPYPDPIMACFKVSMWTPTIGHSFDTSIGGDVGLYQEAGFHSTGDVADFGIRNVAGPLVLEATPRDVRADTMNSGVTLSRISYNSIATLNPDAGTTNAARRTVQLGTGDYLWSVNGYWSVRKIDLFELTEVSTGLVLGTFCMDSYSSRTRMVLRSMSGALPYIAPSGQAVQVRVRWLQPTISIGGRQRPAADPYSGIPQFLVAPPAPLTESYDLNYTDVNAMFMSSLGKRLPTATNERLYDALCWGGFDQYGFMYERGQLKGDGGIVTSGGRQRLNFYGRRTMTWTVSNGGRTVSYDPYDHGGQLQIITNGALTVASNINFAVDTASSGYSPVDGDEFDVYFSIAPGTLGPISVTWPADFALPQQDGVLPPTNTGSGSLLVHFYFRRVNIGSTHLWLGRRTDY